MSDKPDDIKALEKKLKDKLRELITLHRQGKASLSQVLMVDDEMEESYKLALELLAGNKDKQAAKLLSTMCLMQPYDGRYWRILGLALQKIKRPSLALAAFEMALVILPDDVMTLTYRGETFILLGRKVEAARDLETVIEKGKPNVAAEQPFIQRAKGLLRYAKPQAQPTP